MLDHMAIDASIDELDDGARDLGAGGLDDRLPPALVNELGGELVTILAGARNAQEEWQSRRRPEEGLRERKKRLTRQRISDVATALFIARGFEQVRVADVAEVVGVSEKTIYNYFPTKEAMVFDTADVAIERLAAALRRRVPGQSPTQAVVAEIRRDIEQFEFVLGDDADKMLPAFAEMVRATPALRAAWRGIQERLISVAAEELARAAQVDPRDPEPRVAALALVGLQEIAMEAQVRRVEEGLRGGPLRDAVLADVDRGARVLEVGMWSLDLLVQGDRSRRQLQEAAKAAEQARTQVAEALSHARIAWRELRTQEQARKRGRRVGKRQPDSAAGREAAREAARAGREALRSARKAQKSLREVKRPRGPVRRDGDAS
jgi:AcrR family transcriptional regulator